MTGKEDNMSNVITNGTTIPGSTENFMTAFNKTALGIQEMFIALLNNFIDVLLLMWASAIAMNRILSVASLADIFVRVAKTNTAVIKKILFIMFYAQV